MKRRLAAAALVAGLFGSIVGPVRAEVTAEQVRKAIDRGTNYLLEQQRNDGSWPDMIAQPGGVSALCTLALLERRRGAGRRADAEGARLSPHDPARENLRRRAPDDGLRPGRAGSRPRADPPQREMAGEHADQSKVPSRGPGPIPAWAAPAATTPTASSRCWPCTRPSASAWWPTSRRGGWPRPIGKHVRMTMGRGATTGKSRRRTPEA